MQSRALEVLVGFFVCLGVAAVFVLTFRVASLDSIGASDSNYRVVATFDNIGGLRQGSAVTMAGVKVGRVRDIAINRETFEADVTIEMSGDYDNIPEDSIAKILTSGLLGEQYIGIDPGGSDVNLAEGSKLDYTQSALVLENLIGQFVSSQSGNKSDDKLASAIGKLADSLATHSPSTPADGASK